MAFCLDVDVNIVHKSSKTETFGQVLMQRREAKGWSKQYLADRCGISRAYISAFELGRKLKDGITPQKPSKEISDRLAEILGESKDYFRKLNGYPVLADENFDDIVSADFASAMHRYRLLDERARQFIQRQVGELVDFLLDDGRYGTPPQNLQHADRKSLPAAKLEELKGSKKK